MTIPLSAVLMRLVLWAGSGRVLGTSYRSAERSRVRSAAWAHYVQLSATLPREPTLGARVIMRAAALVMGFYLALVDTGTSQAQAREFAARAVWVVYEKMGKLPWVLACLGSGEPERRLRIATKAFRSFPFGPPAYQMVDRPAEAGVVAFDVVRCPAAEYFRAHGLSELCGDAFCDQDYLLAAKWGARLERAGTLARGCDRCDFRWRVACER